MAIELKSLGGEPSNLTEALVITFLCQLIWFSQPILRQLRQSIIVFISRVRIKREEVICLRLYSCLLVQPTPYPWSHDSHMLLMSAHICLASFEKWLRWALLLLEISRVSISQLHRPCFRDEYILKDALVLVCVKILIDGLTRINQENVMWWQLRFRWFVGLFQLYMYTSLFFVCHHSLFSAGSNNHFHFFIFVSLHTWLSASVFYFLKWYNFYQVHW